MIVLALVFLSLVTISRFQPKISFTQQTARCPELQIKFDKYLCAGADLTNFDAGQSLKNAGLPLGLALSFGQFSKFNGDYNFMFKPVPFSAEKEVKIDMTFKLQTSDDLKIWNTLEENTLQSRFQCTQEKCEFRQLTAVRPVSAKYSRILFSKVKSSKPLKDASVQLVTNRKTAGAFQFALKSVACFTTIVLASVVTLKLHRLKAQMPFKYQSVYNIILFSPLIISPAALFAIVNPGVASYIVASLAKSLGIGAVVDCIFTILKKDGIVGAQLLQNGEDVDDTLRNRSRPLRKQPWIFFLNGACVFTFIFIIEILSALVCFGQIKDGEGIKTAFLVIGSILAVLQIVMVVFYLVRHFKAQQQLNPFYVYSCPAGLILVILIAAELILVALQVGNKAVVNEAEICIIVWIVHYAVTTWIGVGHVQPGTLAALTIQ